MEDDVGCIVSFLRDQHYKTKKTSINKGNHTIRMIARETTAAAVTLLWYAALATVMLRRASAWFGRVSHYGGRCVHKGKRIASSPFDRLYIHITRRSAFQSFYVVGFIATAGSLLHAAYSHRIHSIVVAQLFLIHCLVRWIETTFRQKFRGAADDTVTLFAAISGCGFYALAALSTVDWALADNGDDMSTLETQELLEVVVLAAAHVFIQCIQVWHHEILASLRHGAVKGIEPTQRGYRYPIGRGLFHVVQEPHYFCECFLYVIQWALLFAERRGHHGAHAFLLSDPAFLVFAFTCANLGVTAVQHRSYWLAQGWGQRMPRWLLCPGLF